MFDLEVIDMKKVISMILIFIVAIPLFSVNIHASTSDISGIYEGTYVDDFNVCLGITIYVTKNNSEYDMIVEFYELGESNSPNDVGSFNVDTVLNSDGTYDLTQSDWIYKSDYYDAFDIKNCRFSNTTLIGDSYRNSDSFLGIGYNYSRIGSISCKKVTEARVFIDNKLLNLDQVPVFKNSRVMVPIRPIFETLGYTVTWHNDTQTAVAKKGSDTIMVKVGNANISYKMGTYVCDAIPYIEKNTNRILVPVRAISECAGCEVHWDSSNQAVNIYTNSNNTEAIYTNKIIEIEADNIVDWYTEIEQKEKSLLPIKNTFINLDGEYQYTGPIIVDRIVLEYKTIELQIPIPALSADGSETVKFSSIQVPSKISYIMHEHKTGFKSNGAFWGSLIAGLVSQNFIWTQQCDCGYRVQLSWEIPIPDMKKDKFDSSKIYIETKTNVPQNVYSKSIHNQYVKLHK